MVSNIPPSLAEAPIPWFGARKMAEELQAEIRGLNRKLAEAREQLKAMGALTIIELQELRTKLEEKIETQRATLANEKASADVALAALNAQLEDVRKTIVIA